MDIKPSSDLSISALESEAASLCKRWTNFRTIHAGFYEVFLSPSTPNLPVPCSSIRVTCSLPADYPSTPAIISLESCDDLPLSILSRMNQLVHKRLQGTDFRKQVMIKEALRWLENTGIYETLTCVIKEQESEHSPKSNDVINSEENMKKKEEVQLQTQENSTSEVNRVFSSQLTWHVNEHRAFEDALNELIIVRGRNIASASTWEDVSRRIMTHTKITRTPEECLARYLTMQKLCTSWIESSIIRQTIHPKHSPIGANADVKVSEPLLPQFNEKEREELEKEEVEEEEEEEVSFQQTQGPLVRDNRYDMFGREVRTIRSAPVSESEKKDIKFSDQDVNSTGEEGEGEEEDDDEEEEDEDDDEDEEDDHEDHGLLSDDTFSAPPLVNIDLSPKHSGAMLLFERLSIVGVGTFAASRVLLLLQCERCSTIVSASLCGAAFLSSGSPDHQQIPDTELKQWCSKCSLLLSAKFRPTLLHLGNSSLGYVDTTHASVNTLIHASFIATCLECGSASEIPKFQPPQTWESSCRTCFNRLRIDVRSSKIELAEHSVRPNQIIPRREEKMTFTPGQPLPDRGTCEHYRRSYRWLRFPCCEGKAYPCDACHDKASDHPHEWAKRMICGHCAKEQPFSNLPCVSCGGAFIRGGAGGRFWQGGQGQRNQELLSRNDSRKHSENKLKTHSKKATRVGSLKSRQAATPAPRTFERYRNGEIETVIIKEKRPGK